MVTRYAHVNVGELAHTINNLPWPEAGGKLGGHGINESKISMTFNGIMHVAPYLLW